jgi:hypothetical protein
MSCVGDKLSALTARRQAGRPLSVNEEVEEKEEEALLLIMQVC